MARHRPPSGHTLPELLAILVLLGLLSALAAPSMREGIRRARVRAALQQLAADLYRARAHAARSGREMRVRFSPAPSGCAREYALEDVREGRTIRATDVESVAPGVCLRVSGAPSIRIDARGMPVGAARKVRASLGPVSDSLSISMVGRVYHGGR